MKHFKSDRTTTINITSLIITNSNESNILQLQSFKVFLHWAQVIRAFSVQDPTIFSFQTRHH